MPIKHFRLRFGLIGKVKNVLRWKVSLMRLPIGPIGFSNFDTQHAIDCNVESDRFQAIDFTKYRMSIILIHLDHLIGASRKMRFAQCKQYFRTIGVATKILLKHKKSQASITTTIIIK